MDKILSNQGGLFYTLCKTDLDNDSTYRVGSLGRMGEVGLGAGYEAKCGALSVFGVFRAFRGYDNIDQCFSC